MREGPQIPRQRRRIAGDVDNRGRPDRGRAAKWSPAPSPARGGSTTIRSGSRPSCWVLQKCRASRAVDASARGASQILRQRFVAAGADSTAMTSLEACRELPRKQAHAGEEVPGQLAATVGSHSLDKRIDQAIDSPGKTRHDRRDSQRQRRDRGSNPDPSGRVALRF